MAGGPGGLGAGLDQMGDMSDDQLRGMMDNLKGINPAMAGMDPAMMRNAINMMKGMSPEQQANMANMAQS